MALREKGGTYPGRFLRWNSWNVLTDPAGLFHDIAVRLLDPASHPRTYGVTLIFGSGLLLGYAALRALIGRERAAEGELRTQLHPLSRPPFL